MSRARVPWYLWCAALAVTSAYVGGYWDTLWHRSIGRDSFWSAPHMAIYACGILLMLLLAAGFVGIMSATAREASLGAGETLDRRGRLRGWIAGAAAAVVVAVIVYLGNTWWAIEASNYDQYVPDTHQPGTSAGNN